jgi:hypothetical protein
MRGREASRLLPAALAAAVLSWPAAAAVELAQRSQVLLAGSDAALGAGFAARAEASAVTVELGLGGARVVARIDDATGAVSLRSLGPGGADGPAPLEEADLRIARALGAALGPQQPHRVGDALLGTLALLAEVRPGTVLDLAVPGTADAKAAPAGIRSLCRAPRATGSYTLGSRRISRTVVVGSCYNAASECLGRCGRGCRSTEVAGYANPDTVQRFTQDCLDHDLCVQRTGDNLGECLDELLDAVDDFLRAPDCGSLDGAWTDSLAAVWDLDQRDDFSVRGTVTLPRCGRLAVTGRHQGASVALTAATSARPPAGCPARIAYAGRLASCDAASGTFAAGGDRGAWRLSRGRR